MLAERERSGDPALAFLIGVVEMLQAELPPVAQQAQEVAGVLAPGDDEDVGDAGVDQGLDGIEDHRPIEDRQQVLVGDAGQRVEPAPGAACEDHALHGP